MEGHPAECLRSAARKMGSDLYSGDNFARRALEYLSKRGPVEVSQFPPEEGDDDEQPQYLVQVSGPLRVSSVGFDLLESLCGAVHCIADNEAPAPPPRTDSR